MNFTDPAEKTFAQWLKSHGAILHQLSRAYAPEPVDVEELHQEMMVQLWRSIPRFSGKAKASTWIYRVCLNTGLTWRRTTLRREARVVGMPEKIKTAHSAESTPAEHQEKGDLHAALMTAVRALPPGQRSLVVLALDGLAYRQIAEITGLTENHVGVTLSRARQSLTQKMQGISHEL